MRNHCAVPDIDPEEYTLTVSGEGMKETTFTLEDLKTKFEKVEITTVIQCNGNRREDFHYIDGETPAFGPPHWVCGAMGNAKWTGVRMRDVLRAAGLDVDSISLRTKNAPEKATTVGLLGYDHDEVGNQYCCSFPFEKAVDPFGDCLIAYEMNDEPIPRSHGFPVRAIVPGNAGARNCKFLEAVMVGDGSAWSQHGNWKQYAVHAPHVPTRKIAEFNLYKKELMEDPPVMDMPVQSLICNPSAGDIIAAAKNGATSVEVKGIAWGGGGQGVNRVDVSLNNGKEFTRADMLEKPVDQRRKSEWGWVFFEKEIPIPEEMRQKLLAGQQVECVLTSKALNTSWNVQPENPEPNWNSHGCCVNHWYRVPITLCPKATEDIKAPDGDFGNKPSGGRFSTPFRNLDCPEVAEERQSKSQLARKMGIYEPMCTCGNDCAPGTGCLAPRFNNSPSKLYEMNQRKRDNA